MIRFAELFRRVDESTKTNEKVKALVDFFDKAEDKDKIWAIALFSQHRPKRIITTTILRQWACELANIPFWLFEESYLMVGDLAETITLVLPYNKTKDKRKLNEWIIFIQQLKEQGEVVKEKAIKEAWKNLGKQERYIFNKLITGGFRLGVSQKMIATALAKHLNKEESEIAHRLVGDWTPQTTTFQDMFLSISETADISRPYPFNLAYALESNLEDLGSPEEWVAEWKWNGIRAQLIKRNDEVLVWSRGLELITDNFPELKEMAMSLANGTVIDAEILVIVEGEVMGYQGVQKRLGLKKVSKKMMADFPIAMMAYDLMEFEGNDIRDLPFLERRDKLLEIVHNSNDYRLALSEVVEFDDWKWLRKERKKSRSLRTEGFMLKQKSSSYLSGRQRGNWWKWKVDPFTIYGVMIYAHRGQSGRRGSYSDFTFAVWDDDVLVPFTKAFSGLTKMEYAEITKFVKTNTKERFGPVRSINPELVFEITFEGIHESARHKSGVNLRFPTIKRWKKDKKANEAHTLQDLKALIV